MKKLLYLVHLEIDIIKVNMLNYSILSALNLVQIKEETNSTDLTRLLLDVE